jgi:hypothetical protein
VVHSSGSIFMEAIGYCLRDGTGCSAATALFRTGWRLEDHSLFVGARQGLVWGTRSYQVRTKLYPQALDWASLIRPV